MILVSILNKLATDGLGTLDTDLFYEEADLDSNGNPKAGAWIVSRGAPVTRFIIGVQPFDIYVRYKDKLIAGNKSLAILEKLQEYSKTVCDLDPIEEYEIPIYTNVRIIPTSGVESVGKDEQDRMVYVISGEVRYTKT